MGKYNIYLGNHDRKSCEHWFECNTLKDLQYLLSVLPYSKEQTFINVYEDGGFYEVDYDWAVNYPRDRQKGV